MTDWMDVAAVTPRISYIATAGQTLFTVPFVFFDEASLKVYKNGTLLTLTTDYAVSGLADFPSGFVTLTSGAALNDVIMIVRNVAIVQTTHIPPSGPLDVAAVNFQFSKLIAIDQQLNDALGRSPQLLLSDVDGSGTYDFKGNRGINVGAPVDGTDIATKAYADSVQAEAQAGVIVDGSITNAKLANMAGYTVKGNANAATGVPTDISLATINQRLGMRNGKIVASRAANAETYTIQTLAGANPSAADPVWFTVQDGAGGLVSIPVTSALSVTAASGWTLGVPSGTPFRVWIEALNNSGTILLGILTTVATDGIIALDEWIPQSIATTPGTAAQALYGGTTVSSKYSCIVGFASYESGLVTAGTWVTAPDNVIVWHPGMTKPGQQVSNTHRATVTTTSGNTFTSTSYTASNLAVSIFPRSKCNLISVEASGGMFVGTINHIGKGIIQRGGINVGLGQEVVGASAGGSHANVLLRGTDAPSSLALQTYTVMVLNTVGGGSVIFPNNNTTEIGGSIDVFEVMT